MAYNSKYKGVEVEKALDLAMTALQEIPEWYATQSYVDDAIENIKEQVINVTYDELVALRDNSLLSSGKKYRITDYETIVSAEVLSSAGHLFDLIVTAIDERTLDENCRATHSERDTEKYFINSDVSAWDIKYCLDNDNTRFNWAVNKGKSITIEILEKEIRLPYVGQVIIDNNVYFEWSFGAGNEIETVYTVSETPSVGDVVYVLSSNILLESTLMITGFTISTKPGKGVIYELTDENNNTVGYDFKNIMFARTLLNGVFDESGQLTFVYTFHSVNNDGTHEDVSMNGTRCYNNIIEPIDVLGNNVFINTSNKSCFSNKLNSYCKNNTFGDACNNNVLNKHCNNNVFGAFCSGNLLEHDCCNNVFGDYCNNNTMKDSCFANRFGNTCSGNTFGLLCTDNEFESDACYNRLSEACRNNKLGKNSSNNSFGSWCYSIQNIGLLMNSSFGNQCKYIEFSAIASEQRDYGSNVGMAGEFKNIHFGDGCKYVRFGYQEVFDLGAVQNYTFIQGFGKDSTYTEITGIQGNQYETKVTFDSSGKLRIYCEDDEIEIPEIEIPEIDLSGYATKEELELRNVCAVDINEQIDDVNEEYVTKGYVDNVLSNVELPLDALEGFIPFSRDFNDDFNDSFAR